MAQELRGRTGVEIAQAGGRLVKSAPISPAENTKDGNAIWAMEFSKDGKYLAAAGHDHVVRVWAVLATDEDRSAHEREEDSANKDGEQVRLNAPVFKRKPEQEYEAHTASVLDLSWSKVDYLSRDAEDVANRYRTTSCYRLQWTRLCDFGISVGTNAYAALNTTISLPRFNSILEMIGFSWQDR